MGLREGTLAERWASFMMFMKKLQFKFPLILRPFTTACLICLNSLNGQSMESTQSTFTGIVTGQVIDTASGEPVSGAAVSFKELDESADRTDLRGRYSLRELPEGRYTLVVFKGGYRFSEITGVEVKPGEAVTINVPLERRTDPPEAPSDDVYDLAAFVVEADAVASSESVLLYNRRRSITVTDAISEDRFSALGIGDAAQALAKTVGTTIVDGKYAVVRGLGDRYTNTRLNGLSVPSADPDRLAVQLDQFPSDLLESVVTSKTFTADQPGAFSGGSINLKTKAFPNRFFYKAGASFEYNSEATGEEGLEIPGGGKDWTGRDDGTRALSEQVPDPFPNISSTAASISARRGDFGPADEIDQLVGYFDNRPFYPIPSRLDPNWGGSFSIGDRIDYGEARVLGYILAFTYDDSVSHFTDGVVGRYTQGSTDFQSPNFVDLSRVFSPDASIFNFFDLYQNNPLTPLGEPEFGVTRTVYSVDWGAFSQASWQPTSLHEISFRFFHNQSAEDSIRRGVGEAVRSDSGTEFRESYDLLYTERGVTSLQLAGESVIPALNEAIVEWRAATSKSYQDQPDFRSFEFKWNFLFQEYDPSGITNNRYFRELEEENDEASLDFTYPIDLGDEGRLSLKTGYFYSQSERTNRERIFSVEGFRATGESIPLFPQPVGIVSRTANSVTVGTIMREISSNSDYDAERTVEAGYLMADWRINYTWRLVAGARWEQTDILTNPLTVGGLSAQPGVIDEDDLLSHASLIYSITDSMNLRFAYGKTIARPTFRELADIRINEPFTDEVIAGNPNLKMTGIDNFDLRWEWFPDENEVIAVSLFYKELTNPIERTFESGRILPNNSEEGELRGIEFEYRQPLGRWWEALERFAFGINFTFIDSEVEIPPSELAAILETDPEADSSRELFGQSPYVLNIDLTYENPDWGTTLTAVFNIAGERLDLVTTGALPDVFEQPFESLDLILAQRVTDRWALKLSAKNLLNPAKEKTLTHAGETYLYESYKRGVSVALGLSYSFN